MQSTLIKEVKAYKTLGRNLTIDLPPLGVNGLAAKVDTGAYSSAIWASSIKEHDGKLSFKLLGKKSPLYTGETITVDDYTISSVKNSFGQSESRYKVPLKIKMAGQTIKTDFTLADRQNNRYPALIGRRALRGNFLVDVSRRQSKNYSVLLLSSKYSKKTDKYVRNLRQQDADLELTYATYDDLCFLLGGKHNQITLQDGRDIADFGLIYFKVRTGYLDIAAAIADYADQRGVPFIDRTARHFTSASKLYQYVVLNRNKLIPPRTVFMLPGRLRENFKFIKTTLGLPFVLKDVNGNRGEDNYLIKNASAFAWACQTMDKQDLRYMAQAFVPNDGDYRVLVLGDKIAIVIARRRRNDATHLNNTCHGGKAALAPSNSLPTSIRKACINAAQLLDRQVAGVDVVQDRSTGLWYCLEVNDGPQLASGSFTAEKQKAVADYLKQELAGKQP